MHGCSAVLANGFTLGHFHETTQICRPQELKANCCHEFAFPWHAMHGRKVALTDSSIAPKCVAPSMFVLSQGLERIQLRTHGIEVEVVTIDKTMSSVQVHWLRQTATNGRIAYRRIPNLAIEIPDSGSRAPLLFPQNPRLRCSKFAWSRYAFHGPLSRSCSQPSE